MDDRERLIGELGLNPALAHATFFRAKHRHEDAPFHRQLEQDFHSAIPNILWLIFRGSGKSTKFEEGAALEVGWRKCRNLLILGESETRAAERLAAVKHIIEYDEHYQALFETVPGNLWTDTRCVTNTGIFMQAAGRGQSLRGVKHLDARPDLVLLDDIEDKESGSVATPEARKKTRSWLTGTVIPSMAPGGRMRMAATPIHPEALAPTLAKADRSWMTRVYPIVYPDGNGGFQSSWPDRFPVEAVLRLWETYRELGQDEDWAQEYLCQPVHPESQAFHAGMFVREARVRSWHPVYAVYDPARSTTRNMSATTGKVVASWVGSKLVVWEAEAKKWMPNEIIDDIFVVNEKYAPICIGIEETGLEEWLLQPIRTRSQETGTIVPIRPLTAPRGKLDFIRALQPYFKSRDVVFAGEMPELEKQLIAFPTGRIDAPNALAYMLRLKMGTPIYDNFREEMIDDAVRLQPRLSSWILVNSNNEITTALLAQMQSGRLVVIWDGIKDGDPGAVLGDLLAEAGNEIGKDLSNVRFMAGPKHFDEYSLYGVRAAVKGLGLALARGGAEDRGREEIRGLMRRMAHGRSSLSLGPRATWARRAFSGGYARDVAHVNPIANAYAVLIEPLESFAAWLKVGAGAVDDGVQFAYTADGRRYISAMPR